MDPGICSPQRCQAVLCTNRWYWHSKWPSRSSSGAGLAGEAPSRWRRWGWPWGQWCSSTPATTLSPSAWTSLALTWGSERQEKLKPSCWTNHLFKTVNQKLSKNNNVVKYFDNLKSLFYILIYFKMQLTMILDKRAFQNKTPQSKSNCIYWFPQEGSNRLYIVHILEFLTE